VIHQAILMLALALAFSQAGCNGFMRGQPNRLPGSPESVAIEQGYALLYSTINSEAKVDQVLMIKNPDPQVEELLKAIGRFARDAKERLQDFANGEPPIDLDNDGLPELEKKTRTSISSATSKQVVFSGGEKFQFRILLTQHEALNYITHLSESLSRQEGIQTRKEYLDMLSKQSKALHDRVIALLQTSEVDQPK
jgi:hypothetical protein